ncbi:SDR family NAD(P)-dependent oxidoreductase [Kitasatospora sp. NPDC092948]|uniref:SDR family NAD(P)-dependent oxidoreductase n=1 Tax=Kitasatospora sp. NPDC092948 TaxID=3364088 RepID=UPI0038089208
MKNVVITGGNDGIGRGLALAHLERGDNVVVLGRSKEKGQAFLAAAQELGAADRAAFIAADLSLISENKRVIGEIADRFATVDVLVLCARYFRSARAQTSEGLENTFALEYLSRYLLSHGLVERLETAAAPVVVNVSGPGVGKPEIYWNDLYLQRGYNGIAAQMQAGRGNDLLGVSFAEKHGASGIRYILVNPGSTATSFAGAYDPQTAIQVDAMKRMGKPVAQAVAPILEAIDNPPAEPLSAFVEGRRIRVDHPELFSKEAAKRLDGVTEELLNR